MKLTKKKIDSLIRSGRVNGMPPKGTVKGFDDYNGGYYKITMIATFLLEGSEVELFTPDGVEYYLRFI